MKTDTESCSLQLWKEVMINIKVRNEIDQAVEEKFFQKFNALADDMYREMAKNCERYAVMNIKNHTGNLQLSIKAKKSKFKDGGWICMAGSDKGHHAFIVEYGTEGPRRPLLKKVMKFEIDGKVIFAKVVAKMPAKPFMRPARDRVVAEFKRSLK